MSVDEHSVKVHKDAFVSAIFSLSKAAQEASNTLIDLVNVLQKAGVLDASELAHVRNTIAGTVTTAVDALAGASSDPVAHAKPEEAGAKSEPAAAHAEEETGKKKRRRKADPNAPKRPLPAYLTFSNEQKKIIRGEREKKGEEPISMQELNQLVQQRWSDLSKTDREILDSKYKGEVEQFHKDTAKYREGKLDGAEGDDQSSSAKDKDAKDKDAVPPAELVAAETQPSTTEKKKRRKKNQEAK